MLFRIVGHSLGAGTGTLLAILMKKKYPELNLQCYAFAPPPVVTEPLAINTEVLNEWCRSFLERE